jgi:hypothetical protein
VRVLRERIGQRTFLVSHAQDLSAEEGGEDGGVACAGGGERKSQAGCELA